jgi:hypothetical protein
MPETTARMPERRMTEAAVVRGAESAVVESTAMKPAAESAPMISATESTAVEPAAKSTSTAVEASPWPGHRQPAGDHQKCSRNAGSPGSAKRCLVHVRAPLFRGGSPSLE